MVILFCSFQFEFHKHYFVTLSLVQCNYRKFIVRFLCSHQRIQLNQADLVKKQLFLAYITICCLTIYLVSQYTEMTSLNNYQEIIGFF